MACPLVIVSRLVHTLRHLLGELILLKGNNKLNRTWGLGEDVLNFLKGFLLV